MNDDMYEDENGYRILTSSFLKKRPHCCKSNCLHCPYGRTIREVGFSFKNVVESELESANKLISECSGDNFTHSLLSGAFGNSEKRDDVSLVNFDQFHFVFLKNHLCGLIQIDGEQILKLYLKKHFNDQGITKDNVMESYKNVN